MENNEEIYAHVKNCSALMEELINTITYCIEIAPDRSYLSDILKVALSNCLQADMKLTISADITE